jgi:hypothetical protein
MQADQSFAEAICFGVRHVPDQRAVLCGEVNGRLAAPAGDESVGRLGGIFGFPPLGHSASLAFLGDGPAPVHSGA